MSCCDPGNLNRSDLERCLVETDHKPKEQKNRRLFSVPLKSSAVVPKEYVSRKTDQKFFHCSDLWV